MTLSPVSAAPRKLYGPDHELLRQSVRRYLTAEIVPLYQSWEKDGIMPRQIFRDAAERGYIGMEVPEALGGGGNSDFRFSAVISEEASRLGLNSYCSAIATENDICIPYFLKYGTDDQLARWMPGITSGQLVTAIAMTEPGTGSDLASIQTRAVPTDRGYVVSGAKTFITNGINADLVIVAVRTGSTGTRGDISLVVVERDFEGFRRGRNLDKIGLHAQDTAELFFDDVLVPRENLLGAEGEGFRYLSFNLARERLSIAVASMGACQGVLDETLAYVKDRQAFGQPIGTFQNSRFQLAECHAEITVAQAYVDQCIEALNDETLEPDGAAIAKWWCTDVQSRVVDKCLQLHGGYGYMTEYPVARAYVDARITRIYGGTNEIMKEIVGKRLGLR